MRAFPLKSGPALRCTDHQAAHGSSVRGVCASDPTTAGEFAHLDGGKGNCEGAQGAALTEINDDALRFRLHAMSAEKMDRRWAAIDSYRSVS
jgi:hypothetical protein